MKWNNTEISKLWDADLKAAYITTAEMDMFRSIQIRDNKDKFDKKFKNQPTPQINPAFVQLQTELEEELNKRKLL